MILQILAIPLWFAIMFGFSALCWWFTPHERMLRKIKKAERL